MPTEPTASGVSRRGFIALGIGVVLLVVAQWIFNHFENKMPERL